MTTRRDLLGFAAAGAALSLPASAHRTAPEGSSVAMWRKRIPRTGELLPCIGLGTSRTFDVPHDADLAGELAPRLEVFRAFLAAGGSLVDSSPMYGQAEAVVGRFVDETARGDLFLATKVWTEGRDEGVAQMTASEQKMRTARFDLMQVHNLVDYATHLATLRAWKAEGRIRYLGITEMRDLERVEKIVREDGIDFLQIPYSIQSREVEARVLPACLDHGVAVLVMRPFERGELFRRVKDRPLPELATELGCTSWAQVFLKFLLGHPAVTCPIPATSKPKHLFDNVRAGVGPFPDEAQRRELVELLDL